MQEQESPLGTYESHEEELAGLLATLVRNSIDEYFRTQKQLQEQLKDIIINSSQSESTTIIKMNKVFTAERKDEIVISRQRNESPIVKIVTTPENGKKIEYVLYILVSASLKPTEQQLKRSVLDLMHADKNFLALVNNIV